MQLATQTEEPDQKVSPSTYSALIDSLFQNPAPLFAGGVMVAFAAAMRTISYGKERPVAVCNDISCWSQNRRAVTVLNASS